MPNSAWASSDEDRAAEAVEIGLSEREGFADPQPGSPEEHDQRAKALPVRSIADDSHHSDDLFHRRRVGWVLLALAAWRAAAVVTGHGRWRAAMAGSVGHDGFHGPPSWVGIA
jgi:hypothetical protein